MATPRSLAAAIALAGIWMGDAALSDVEHVVIFMQENRAYDHYYGALRGVRGFGDRAAPALPNGRSPFYQPIGDPVQDLYQVR